MKIAFAIEHFDPARGGAEQYAWGLGRWLVDNGHELSVFAKHFDGAARAWCEVIPVKPAPGLRATRTLRLSAALRAALDNRVFDLVHGFNHVQPCDLLRLGGGVHIAFESANAASVRNPAARAARRVLDELMPKNRALRKNEKAQFGEPGRHFIAVSRRVARDIACCYPACADRVHVIHNGVDASRFSPEQSAARRAGARKALGLGADERALLFVSNNYRLKGLHDLLDAMALLRQRGGSHPTLLIAGRGHARPFERQASHLGLAGQLRFIGSGPMEDRYAAADALVHPSFYDAFGFVVLEAAACGLPIVCSRNSGASELLRDGDGSVLIDMPCDPSVLADAISRVLEPGFAAAARAANRAVAEANGLEANYRKVEALYRQIIDIRKT